MTRFGFGYDVHRLVAGRPLMLGGVQIDHEKGLDGHSDADVLLHAISDALLGAAALGDIGKHFPDTDPVYKDVNSMVLLEKIIQLLREKGLRIGNVDATIAAQEPKLAPYISPMIGRISACLGVQEDQVNVKATTTEGLGFVGTGEGIAAYAVCSLTDGL